MKNSKLHQISNNQCFEYLALNISNSYILIKHLLLLDQGGTSTQSIKNVIVANYEVYRVF